MNRKHAVAGDNGACAYLQAEGLRFSYRAEAPVLNDVSLSVTSGEFLGILGVNGCGKSTLLNCLAGLIVPQAGRVLLNGAPLASYTRDERASRIGYVAQHSHATAAVVYDTLLLGRVPYMGGVPSRQDHAVVERALERFGMQRLALSRVSELSGGEYQKLMIARAFVQQTGILLLDEPTNNLDLYNVDEVLGMVRKRVDAEGLAAVAVLHDVNAALRHCNRLIVMRAGRVLAAGGVEIVTEELIAQAYGVAVDVIEHGSRKLVVVK